MKGKTIRRHTAIEGSLSDNRASLHTSWFGSQSQRFTGPSLARSENVPRPPSFNPPVFIMSGKSKQESVCHREATKDSTHTVGLPAGDPFPPMGVGLGMMSKLRHL